METDILMYTASYFGLRLAILAAFASAFYWVLRPSPALARSESIHARVRRADKVCDDSC